MKKVIYSKYGDVSVLEMIETTVPPISETSVLVGVKAVSINPLDWKIREGQMKMMSGSTFPKGVGIDFSGVIQKTGPDVKGFKAGDAVFGLVDVFKGAALAEYLVVSESDIALKPQKISFEQASTLGVTGLAALQILSKVKIREGSEVLINGGTGGIGMYLTQFLKQRSVHLTSVTSERSAAVAKKWGSDVVISYEKDNIFKLNRKFDLVVDLSGTLPFTRAKEIMKDTSGYVNTTPGLQEIIASALNNMFSRKKYHVLLLKRSAHHLRSIAECVDNVDIVIGKSFSFDSFRDAYEQVPFGRFVGKAVITIP